jgi:hypothetical protein
MIRVDKRLENISAFMYVRCLPSALNLEGIHAEQTRCILHVHDLCHSIFLNLGYETELVSRRMFITRWAKRGQIQ